MIHVNVIHEENLEQFDNFQADITTRISESALHIQGKKAGFMKWVRE